MSPQSHRRSQLPALGLVALLFSSCGAAAFLFDGGSSSGGSGGSGASGTSAPVVGNLSLLPGSSSGVVAIGFSVADPGSDPVSISVEWRAIPDPDFAPASLLGGDLSQVATSPAGSLVEIEWDTLADGLFGTFTVELRITADDGTQSGAALISAPFEVFNDSPDAPFVTLAGAAAALNPDRRRGLPMPYELSAPGLFEDLELVFQWRRAGESFPELPATRAELELALADPDALHSLRIASEVPLFATGRVAVRGPNFARLPELARPNPLSAEPSLIGLELEILRAVRRPRPSAAGWAGNPLQHPVAVLPEGAGESALVLDRGAPGSWRLLRLELATGRLLEELAGADSGDPSALARASQGSLFVASDAAGAWSIHRVDPSSGAAQLVGSSAVPALEPGPIRALWSAGEERLLFTAGSSLLALELSSREVFEARPILGDLETPWGLTGDPRRPQLLYLAERDFVDPETLEIRGRVSCLDLNRMLLRSLVAAELARPRALVLEPEGHRLLAVCDGDAADGTLELCALELSGAGELETLAEDLPEQAGAIGVGADGLRVLALGPAADLAIGGGLEQRRTIAGFDARTLEVSVEPAFDPALEGQPRWRIKRAAPGRVEGERSGTFVWDSSAVFEGGEVFLRALVYSDLPGLPSESAEPLTVVPGLAVEPAILGGPAHTPQPRAVIACDLNGDGALDLACASAGADGVALFFQGEGGGFDPVPDVVLRGLAAFPSLEPVDLCALDADADGDLDLASANRASADFTLFRQVVPGVFGALSLPVEGLSAPVAIVAADLDGDGREDLALADEGGDGLAIFLQLESGLFAAQPTALLGSPSATPAPRALVAGDLDGDADVDLVCATGEGELALFLQSAGVFPVLPDVTLPGPGKQQDVRALSVFDLDGDGRQDLVAVGEEGLSVFLQHGQGGFGPAPDLSLSGEPVADPRAVELAELLELDGELSPVLVLANAQGQLSLHPVDFEGDVEGGIEGGVFGPPLVLGTPGQPRGPVALAVADLNADGALDLVGADSVTDDLSLFLQVGAGSFAPEPELSLGDAASSPGLAGLAAGDLDGDGDSDLVGACPQSDRLALFSQLAPGVFTSMPDFLGEGGALGGPLAVALADLDGDAALDLVSANRDGGDLALFLREPGKSFASQPELSLGAGSLGQPVHVAILDLDGDGLADIVSANRDPGELTLFLQAEPGESGEFGGFGKFGLGELPDLTLGGIGQTNGASFVTGADLDGDGDNDLVCASEALDRLSLFFQDSPGVFSGPVGLGGAGISDAPRGVASFDLEGDGDLDLVSANHDGDDLTIFVQSAPGIFESEPCLRLAHPALRGPESVTAADLDGDGDPDLVAGYSASGNLAVFEQTAPGTFARPRILGGATSASTGTLLVIDLDGDGDPDLLSGQADGGAAAVFFGSH